MVLEGDVHVCTTGANLSEVGSDCMTGQMLMGLVFIAETFL